MSLFEASELRDSKCESRSSIVESEKSLLRKSRYLLTKCLSSHNTITQSQVLPCHKQIYVLAWYRPRYQSPWYYIKSVFQYNNEALNFWTHFIPLLHFLYSYYYFYLDVEHSNETFCFPYYAHGLGCCIVLAASSTAHLFASHSEAVCYSCYALDRACIFTYAFSIRVAFEHYLCPMGHFCNWPSSAVTLAIFASYWSLSFAVVLFAETYATTLGRVIMVVTNLIGGFVGFSSCILRYYFDFSPHPEHMSFHIGHDFSNLMAMAAGTFIIGCLIYSFRIPEIFSPGTFDVIGRSHQWMHVFTAASMYAQSAMFRYNIDEIRDKLDSGIILEEDVSVTFGETIGAVIASAILTNSAILLHWAIVRRGDPKRKRV